MIVDNNTWNNTHIATVGRAMASPEKKAWQIFRSLDVEYVFVVFGGFIGCACWHALGWAGGEEARSPILPVAADGAGPPPPPPPRPPRYPSDDINKFLWMVRIGGGVFPEIKEPEYMGSDGQYRLDSGAGKALLESTMYRLSYYRFADTGPLFGAPRGYDRVRNNVIGLVDFKCASTPELLLLLCVCGGGGAGSRGRAPPPPRVDAPPPPLAVMRCRADRLPALPPLPAPTPAGCTTLRRCSPRSTG